MAHLASKSLKILVILMPILILVGILFSIFQKPGPIIPDTGHLVDTIFLPFFTKSSTPAPLAFPGAEGFGKDTPGGRGGKIIEVTNLNDSGAGSFRAAVEASGPRIVVFRVGGTIELKSTISIRNPYITIAGQTAPGGGITIRNLPTNHSQALGIRTHDVVLRYIRVRSGPPDVTVSDGDALEILGPEAYNLMVDHCSFSWGLDETVTTWYDAHDITFQWNIIAEGLDCSKHVKGCHSMGLLLGSQGAGDITVHHNLFAHNGNRNPLLQVTGIVDVVNNVIFDATYTPMEMNDGYGAMSANIIGNLYMRTDSNSEYLVSPSSESGLGMKIYLDGNITPTRPTDNLNENLVVKSKGWQWIVSTWIEVPSVTTTSAYVAYEQVMAGAGATTGLDSMGNTFTRRDSVDERILNDVRNNIARRVNDPSEVGGWPVLDPGTPYADTDKDGMPDDWERKYGLNPNYAADGPADADGDGYTNVEEFLNVTNPTVW